MGFSLDDFLAGIMAASADTTTAIPADRAMNAGSMKRATTGVPSGFSANFVKA